MMTNSDQTPINKLSLTVTLDERTISQMTTQDAVVLLKILNSEIDAGRITQCDARIVRQLQLKSGIGRKNKTRKTKL